MSIVLSMKLKLGSGLDNPSLFRLVTVRHRQSLLHPAHVRASCHYDSYPPSTRLVALPFPFSTYGPERLSADDAREGYMCVCIARKVKR